MWLDHGQGTTAIELLTDSVRRFYHKEHWPSD
jgi:hypothetical protein